MIEQIVNLLNEARKEELKTEERHTEGSKYWVNNNFDYVIKLLNKHQDKINNVQTHKKGTCILKK